VTVDPDPAPSAEPTEPTESIHTTGNRRPGTNSWNWLLIIPLIGTLVPPFFNKATPRLGGIPFFYWYQLLWIPIAVTVTLVVYRTSGGAGRREAGDE
jgi:hypothetical protein